MSTIRVENIEDLTTGRVFPVGNGGIIFDSVADMQAATWLTVGQKVRTLGYYTPGDGGGNDYEIVAAATGTDDGGSFIDLSGSGLQAKGLFIDGQASVKQFGGVEGEDNTPLVLTALTVSDVVYINNGCHYRRGQVTVPDGKVIIDDSAGIRVTSREHWWHPRYTKNITLAHRGAGDLAPENTMAAISNAYCMGFDGVEIDIEWTADNVPVLMHDRTVDRTTDGTGNVSDYTLAQIQELSAGIKFAPRFAGCKVPTLETALDYMKGRFERIHLEVKDRQTIGRLQLIVDMVVDRGMQNQVVFIAYNNNNLVDIRGLNKDVGLGFIDSFDGEFYEIQKLGGRLYCSFHPTVLDPDPDVVRRARSYGIDVYGKITNQYDEAYRYMELGIGIIQSDNGVMVKGQAHPGNPIKINRSLKGVQKDAGVGEITSNPDTGVITITSATGGRTSILFPSVLASGDYYDVELYGRTVSGDAALAWINNTPFENVELDFDTKGDVYRFRERLYLKNRADGPIYQPLRLGYGYTRVGTFEFFDFSVSTNSKYATPQDGAFSGMIWLDQGNPRVVSNWATFGIHDVKIDPSRNHVVAVLLDMATPEVLAATVHCTSNATEMVFAKYINYKKPGEDQNIWDRDCIFVAIFDAQMQPIDLTQQSAGYLAVRG